jgi:hypothetical protein
VVVSGAVVTGTSVVVGWSVVVVVAADVVGS